MVHHPVRQLDEVLLHQPPSGAVNRQGLVARRCLPSAADALLVLFGGKVKPYPHPRLLLQSAEESKDQNTYREL
jgi:hypothetical protein